MIQVVVFEMWKLCRKQQEFKTKRRSSAAAATFATASRYENFRSGTISQSKPPKRWNAHVDMKKRWMILIERWFVMAVMNIEDCNSFYTPIRTISEAAVTSDTVTNN